MRKSKVGHVHILQERGPIFKAISTSLQVSYRCEEFLRQFDAIYGLVNGHKIRFTPCRIEYSGVSFSTFSKLLALLSFSQIKQLLELSRRVLRASHRVTNGPGVLKDLVVVTALERLVTKEVHSGIRDAARLLGLVLQVLQAVRLVPAGGEDIKRNLAADAEGEAQVTKALAQLLDKRFAHLVLLVKDLVVNALLDAGIPTDRRDIDHAVAELDKGAALDGDVQVGNVVEAERG